MAQQYQVALFGAPESNPGTSNSGSVDSGALVRPKTRNNWEPHMARLAGQVSTYSGTVASNRSWVVPRAFVALETRLAHRHETHDDTAYV